MSNVTAGSTARRLRESDLELVVEETYTTPTLTKAWSNRPDDPARDQWMKLIETSGAYDFWDDPGEDIYSQDDGDPT